MPETTVVPDPKKIKRWQQFARDTAMSRLIYRYATNDMDPQEADRQLLSSLIGVFLRILRHGSGISRCC